MNISVIVATLGERENEIERLLDSLEKQIYKDFEVIFITQGNHERITDIIKNYTLAIKQVMMSEKGLSKARNNGIQVASGEIIVLSDDDCWYPPNAFEDIVKTFVDNKAAQIVLTQIYDPEQRILYKNYNTKQGFISSKLRLMSKSSIEIAYKKDILSCKEFDELFGLGSVFVCGEEVDFLVNNFKKNTIYYKPIVTVFHKKKENASSQEQIVAKGAIYGKNFKLIICFFVLLRDLLVKKENNFKLFFEGYHEYIERKN